MYLLSVHRSLSAVHVCIKRDLPCGEITPHHKLAIASYNFTTHGYTIYIMARTLFTYEKITIVNSLNMETQIMIDVS